MKTSSISFRGFILRPSRFVGCVYAVPSFKTASQPCYSTCYVADKLGFLLSSLQEFTLGKNYSCLWDCPLLLDYLTDDDKIILRAVCDTVSWRALPLPRLFDLVGSAYDILTSFNYVGEFDF